MANKVVKINTRSYILSNALPVVQGKNHKFYPAKPDYVSDCADCAFCRKSTRCSAHPCGLTDERGTHEFIYIRGDKL